MRSRTENEQIRSDSSVLRYRTAEKKRKKKVDLDHLLQMVTTIDLRVGACFWDDTKTPNSILSIFGPDYYLLEMSSLFNFLAVGVRYYLRCQHEKNESNLSQTLSGIKKIASRMNRFFFGVKEFFSWIPISKMEVKINLKIIIKNHAADLEIKFLAKSIKTHMATQWPCRQRWR